jgi:late competence protein required for DNA uptake (superfamily II DNA/RNA helicase)
MICQFISNKEDKYYKSDKFQNTLLNIQNNPNLCQIKEKKKNNEEKLLLVFNEVQTLTQAISYLKVF